MILSPTSTWPGELANDPGPKLEAITNACPSRPGHRLVLWRTVSAAVLKKVRTLVLRYSQSCRPRPGLLEKETDALYLKTLPLKKMSELRFSSVTSTDPPTYSY